MAADVRERKRSNFLKGWGKAWMIFKAIVDAVLARGGGDEELERVLTDSTLCGKIADLIVGAGMAAQKVVSRILSIPRAVAFDPVAFIGSGWKVLKHETDHRATKLTEVDFTKVNFETCLHGEPKITGEEKLKRLKESGNIRLDAGVFLALWNEWRNAPEDKKSETALEWLYREKGLAYLDFMGTVFESPSGYRFVLYLYRCGDGAWRWGCHWLRNGWDAKCFSGSPAE